jgi:AAA domain/Primase C terminal 2 (PriCT-2)/Bifunctional DNA primase/polymerase, N-terminal
MAATCINGVRAFRKRAIANGYCPIPVRTRSKQPARKGWQNRADAEQLLEVSNDELNTGVLAGGLRCIDVDVDVVELVLKIFKVVRQRLPHGGLVRRRADSVRLAIVYRAAEGQPGKRSVAGSMGKVEVLGAGQQFVADGIHPSGASIYWLNGRGPDTVARDQLPAVTEDQIDELLNECAALLGANSAASATAENKIFEKDVGSGFATFVNNTDPNDVLSAGIARTWFVALNPEEKSTLVRAFLDALDNRVNDPREKWLQTLFAVADAERLGCPGARDLALEWSRRGASWTGEADFDKTWCSSRPGGIGIGTLLAQAKEVGLDLSPWRDIALNRLNQSTGAGPNAASANSAPHRRRRAVHVSALPVIPEKRQWLHGTDAMRGAVSLFVAPGGRGKSSWLIALALACASGRSLLGPHVFGGPLRVLLLSAEDPKAEVSRRVRAAMQHHRLADQDVAGLHIIGADDWSLSLLRSVGNVPAADPDGWAALNAELDDVEPDVLILDPLLSLMGGVDGNNNSAAAVFMGGLVKLAAERRIGVVVAHHTAKGRDLSSAESAMGAASFVNFSRIGLSIEPLAESEAVRIGVAPWDAKFVFRVLGIKQNFSAPEVSDRWFRYVSVELPNANPPVYLDGDKVAVVEPFEPGASGPVYGAAILAAALKALDGASPPLSPSKRATGRYAADAIATAIAPYRNGNISDVEAKAVLDHIIRSGLASVQKVKVPRPGGRADERDGLVVTPQGKAAMQQPDPTGVTNTMVPQSPQPSRGNDAGLEDGGSPKGPRNVPRGCGGNAGDENAGSCAEGADSGSSKTQRQAPGSVFPTRGTQPPAAPSDTPAAIPAATASVMAPLLAPPPATPSQAQTGAPSSTDPGDDLDIPPFLRRERKQGRGRPEPTTGTAPLHQRPTNTSTSGGARVSAAASIDINKGPRS